MSLAPPGAPAADGRCRASPENPAFFAMRTLRFSHLKPCVLRIGRRLAHGGTAGFQRRTVDDELAEVFPEIAAISLDGSKAVGKTTTAGQRARSRPPRRVGAPDARPRLAIDDSGPPAPTPPPNRPPARTPGSSMLRLLGRRTNPRAGRRTRTATCSPRCGSWTRCRRGSRSAAPSTASSPSRNTTWRTRRCRPACSGWTPGRGLTAPAARRR